MIKDSTVSHKLSYLNPNKFVSSSYIVWLKQHKCALGSLQITYKV